jgi:ubiquinone/menaquinone biosynthesis C-methylase UbiE
MKMNSIESFVINSSIRQIIQKLVEVKDFLDVPNNLKRKKVLEVGCGNGYGTSLINKYFEPSNIYGIYLDEKMIERAKRNKSFNANFTVGDASRLPFKDSSFHGVFDFAILHHIPNWKKAIDEIHRVLKKGGQVFIEDASIETFSTSFGRLMRVFTDHPYGSMYKMDEFFEYFQKKGFKILKKEIHKPLGLTSRFVLIGLKN